MRRSTALLLALAGTLLLASCSDRGPTSGRLSVVATTAILGDFARQVAGPDADVSVIIPPGVDVHSFEATPAVAKDVARAGLVIVNGYHLEESMLRVVGENKSSRATVVVAARGLKARAAIEEHEGHGDQHDEPVGGLDALATAEGDPHLWLSVANARRYVENIRDGMIAADAAHADGYRTRASTYLATLDVLDVEIKASVATIPQQRRQIVVFHDAYGYFAEAYGFTLIASILPNGANQQVSAQKIAAVVDIVRRSGVKAIYRETEFQAGAIEAVANETGTRVVALSSIYAGPITDYPSLMRANTAALVEGLAH